MSQTAPQALAHPPTTEFATAAGTKDVLGWGSLLVDAAPWTPPDQPVTVVAPHPDDETLMFGGLISMLRERGVRVRVLAVTDGEAAYPGYSPRALAVRRLVEQTIALGRLGVDPPEVVRLGAPDGSVSSHEDELVARIVDLADPVILAPWEHDPHPDHEACGRAARMAAQELGSSCVGGLFWTWQHAPSPQLGAEVLVKLPLTDAAWVRRKQALEAHRSQTGDEYGVPVLLQRHLEPIQWRAEYYVAVNPASIERIVP